MIRSKFKPVLTLSAAVLLLLATGALAQESQINIQSNRGLRARPEGPADAWQNEPMGPTSSFSASAVPSLKQFLRDVAKVVPSPKGGTVYEAWQKASQPEANPSTQSPAEAGKPEFKYRRDESR